MNYTVSGIFSVEVRAGNYIETRKLVEKMFKANSKIRCCVIEITEEGKTGESGKKDDKLQAEAIW